MVKPPAQHEQLTGKVPAAITGCVTLAAESPHVEAGRARRHYWRLLHEDGRYQQTVICDL